MKKFEVIYYKTVNGKEEFSHSYWEEWEQIDLFCPKCGKQKIWEEQGAGDYYEGALYICTFCEFGFTMPRLYRANSKQDKQRLIYISGK